MDKTGLFFRALPTKSLAVKREKCTRGKMSKQRLCGNMVVEMEKPLMTEKATKPRCLNYLKINTLPVIWRNNKKAWMTAATMEEWLKMFNVKIKRENRNAIPFLDKAICHQKVTLLNVKIAWFPANATSLYGCFLYIQIVLQTISDAILDLKCRRNL
jgi:hypothetical protein